MRCLSKGRERGWIADPGEGSCLVLFDCLVWRGFDLYTGSVFSSNDQIILDVPPSTHGPTRDVFKYVRMDHSRFRRLSATDLLRILPSHRKHHLFSVDGTRPSVAVERLCIVYSM